MGVEDKQTYGEVYWAMQLEAVYAEQTKYEEELSPFISDIIAGLQITDKLPPSIKRMFDAMSSPPHPAWSTIMSGWTSALGSQVSQTALGHALLDFNYQMGELFADLRIDAPTASILWSRKKITEDMFDARMLSQGFKDAEAAAYYEATQPYPSIPDIMAWARYQTDPYNIKSTVWKKYNVTDVDFELWEWLSGTRLTIPEVQNLYKRGVYTENQFKQELAKVGYARDDLPLIENLTYSIPNAMLLLQGDLFRGVSETEIIKHVIMADVHPNFAGTYIDAVLTKPSATDLIAYQLRFDPNLNNLGQELRKIGIHSNYHNMYKELAYQIPPVADIITMAVREAFTPAIASKFGQYEDLPAAYVKYVGMKGLSKEWAERYWAAHWNLPSPMQGFEMLHRGIITKEELIMLLRALDVMPFWRDKLVLLAYNVYNRIDIRRMYALGILDRDEVYKAYLENGYDETKSQQLTEFTVRQQIASLTGFSSKSIISAYSKGLINSSQATTMLNNIRVPATDINEIMQAANYRKEWEIKSLQIESTEHLYKNKTITESVAHSKLANLAIPSNEIELMLNKWKLAVKIARIATWTTAQTLSLFKRGIITELRARNELTMLDFDKEHIDALIRNAQATV